MRSIFFALLMSFTLSMCHTQSAEVDQRTTDNQNYEGDNLIEEALGGVVTVVVTAEQPVAKVLLGFRGEIAEEAYQQSLILSDALGSGSGFVIKRNRKLYVVTNAHVVESAADELGSIEVYTITRDKYRMRLVGGDSFYDIAVLEFIDPPGSEVSILEFTDELPSISEKVYAIGNPLGEYPYTVTDGIISALNRVRGGLTGKFGYIQTTATLIWGNSGGPLINEAAKVVGINSQIAFAQGSNGDHYLQQQINFSLDPLLSVQIIDDILEYGKKQRAYFGLEISQNFQLKQSYDGAYISGAIDEFPVISAIVEGSPAMKAYDKIGWQINKVNGEQIRNLEEVMGALEKVKPEEMVKLSLIYGTEKSEVSIKANRLEAAQLEAIAQHVINQTEDLILDENSAQVRIMAETKSYQKPNYRYGLEQKYPSAFNPSYYYMIGAGVYSEDVGNDVWRVTTMADLGAILKIFGPRAGIQYFLVNKDDINEEVHAYEQQFSKSENEYRPIIWY